MIKREINHEFDEGKGIEVRDIDRSTDGEIKVHVQSGLGITL